MRINKYQFLGSRGGGKPELQYGEYESGFYQTEVCAPVFYICIVNVCGLYL